MDILEQLTYIKPGILTKDDLPAINFSHIRTLTDRTGIMQHALYDIPNRKEGYCIDDNSRALLLAILAAKDERNEFARRLLPVYFGFIHYMQNDNGSFRNFMCYDRSCHEEVGSEDSFGRTLMALGYLVNECPVTSLNNAGKEIFEKASPCCDDLVSVRGIANSIIGLCQFLRFNYPDDLKKELIIRLADKMLAKYQVNKDGSWHWFEPVLSYDNAILPLALLHAYEMTGTKKYLSVARESMLFLESKVFFKNILRPIGNKGWLYKGGVPAQFDQQGIDAMAMVMYYQQAWKLTQDKKYLERMCASYQWFLGANDLGISLYDPVTGGCADGLQEDGINLNQGAESTLAYWISHILTADTLTQ